MYIYIYICILYMYIYFLLFIYIYIYIHVATIGPLSIGAPELKSLCPHNRPFREKGGPYLKAQQKPNDKGQEPKSGAQKSNRRFSGSEDRVPAAKDQATIAKPWGSRSWLHQKGGGGHARGPVHWEQKKPQGGTIC